MEGNIPDFYADKMAQSFQETEWQRLVFVNFNGLNGVLKRDGNQWCAITGEMPEHYIAGFGDTPCQAILKWNESFYTPIKITSLPVK